MTFRRRLRRNIEGTPISIVDNVASIDQLSTYDYVMASQPDCIADVIDGGYWKSSAVPFDVFMQQISADVYRALGFGSMVNEMSSDYSPAVHVHPEYSGLSVTSYCSNRRDPTLCSLVTFEDDGFSENVSIPAVAKPTLELAEKLQLAPRIGEMRLFGAQTYEALKNANKLELDMSNPLFSGWAVPDGSALDPERFPGAAEVLGSRLPVMPGLLMKLNPYAENCTEGKNAAAELGQLEPAPAEQHQHPVQQGTIKYGEDGKGIGTVKFNYNVHYNIAVDDTLDWSYANVDNVYGDVLEYGYTPCPCTSRVLFQVGMKVKASIDGDDLDADIAPYEDGIKTEPSYTPVLALVYIGKPYSLPSTSGIDDEAEGLLADDQYALYMPE